MASRVNDLKCIDPMCHLKIFTKKQEKRKVKKKNYYVDLKSPDIQRLLAEKKFKKM